MSRALAVIERLTVKLDRLSDAFSIYRAEVLKDRSKWISRVNELEAEVARLRAELEAKETIAK